MREALDLAVLVMALTGTVIALLILLLTLRILVAIRAYLGEFVASLGMLTPTSPGSAPTAASAPAASTSDPFAELRRWMPGWVPATEEERQQEGSAVISDVYGAGDADVFDPLEAAKFGSRQTRGRDE